MKLLHVPVQVCNREPVTIQTLLLEKSTTYSALFWNRERERVWLRETKTCTSCFAGFCFVIFSSAKTNTKQLLLLLYFFFSFINVTTTQQRHQHQHMYVVVVYYWFLLFLFYFFLLYSFLHISTTQRRPNNRA